MESVIRLLEKLLQALELTHLQVRLKRVLIPDEGATGEKSEEIIQGCFISLSMELRERLLAFPNVHTHI